MKGIKKMRIARNISQAKLARMIGVTVITISRYETGTRTPNVKRLNLLSKALGCTVDDLLNDD